MLNLRNLISNLKSFHLKTVLKLKSLIKKTVKFEQPPKNVVEDLSSLEC